MEISGCGRACPESVGGRPALVEHKRSIRESWRQVSTSVLLKLVGAAMVVDGKFLLYFCGFIFSLSRGEYVTRSSDSSLLKSFWSSIVLFESTVAFEVILLTFTVKISSSK